MNDETLQVFSGSAITPEELLVLAEFAAPSHFVSDEHLHDAAENLAEWTDHRVGTRRRPRCVWRRARTSAPASSSCCAPRRALRPQPAAGARVLTLGRRVVATGQSASPPPSSTIVCPVT